MKYLQTIKMINTYKNYKIRFINLKYLRMTICISSFEFFTTSTNFTTNTFRILNLDTRIIIYLLRKLTILKVYKIKMTYSNFLLFMKTFLIRENMKVKIYMNNKKSVVINVNEMTYTSSPLLISRIRNVTFLCKTATIQTHKQFMTTSSSTTKEEKNFIKVLEKVKNDKKLSLFHEICDEIIKVNKDIPNYFEPQELTSKINQLIHRTEDDDIDSTFHNNYYYKLEADDMMVLKGIKDDSKTHFARKRHYLREIIKQAKDTINSPEKSKGTFIPFYKELFKNDNAENLIYDFFYNALGATNTIRKDEDIRKEEMQTKLTTLCISFSETILEFLTIQIGNLNILYNCFNYKNAHRLSSEDIAFIEKILNNIFTDSLMEKDEDIELKTTKKEYSIKKANEKAKTLKKTATLFNKANENDPKANTNTTITRYITFYLKELFIKKYKRNCIYNQTIKSIVEKYVKTHEKHEKYDLATFITDVTKKYVSLGFYFLALLTENKTNGFEIINIMQDGREVKCYQPSNLLMQDMMQRKQHQKPYLTVSQLYYRYKADDDEKKKQMKDLIKNNLNKFIHDNPKINLSVNNDSYIHKKKLHTKLTIDVDYLTIFLNLLLKDKITTEYLATIYDINNIKISRLLESENTMFCHILQTIVNEIRNFTEIKTATQLKTIIKNKIESFKNDSDIALSIKNNLKELLNEHEDYFYELCDKICQYKYLLVDLINNAIRYSIYKYIIFTTFIDARGRAYLASVSLNIFTNPTAKLFVKLYDANEGRFPFGREFGCLHEIMTFQQTKQQMLELHNAVQKNVNSTADRGLAYVRSIHYKVLLKYVSQYFIFEDRNAYFLDCDSHLKDEYSDDEEHRLKCIKNNIKKQKDLFYVHSILTYIKLILQGRIHNLFMVPYIKMDATTSGFQMMSILFRNPSLAIQANLTGLKYIDMYQKIADGCHAWFNELKKFVTQNNIIDILNSEILNSWFSVKIEEEEEFTNIKILLHKLLHAMPEYKVFNNEDVKKCNFVLQTLPTYYKDLIKDLCKLQEFLDLESNLQYLERKLQYLFCLRYASRINESLVTVVLKGDNSEKSIRSFFNRDLTKQHVMTYLYMSTAYGRKESYYDFICDKYIISKSQRRFVRELSTFLETSATLTMTTQYPHLNVIEAFLNVICKDEKIILTNKNFDVTLDPRVTTNIQVSCSSIHGRASQLVIKKIENEVDVKKLKSMTMANIAHFLDSDVMHHFVQLCLQANVVLKKNKSFYRIVFERNHDCFVMNFGPFLKIFVEEAYLRVAAQDNLRNIKANFVEQFQDEKQLQNFLSYFFMVDTKEFINNLKTINPFFIK